uniref:CCHC-type domain-containing protein n=1 Tax=Tanacetum cinerariifolium TaxID=118510 RepID=A0A6L2LPY4_TANCI|nr:hypothetical protein [Tanacetum cinerariifolium]
MRGARGRAYAIDDGIWFSVVSSKMKQLHSFTCAQVAAGHPEASQGLRHHSPIPQGAAVVAVPSSDRHHNGGLAADSPYSTPNHDQAPPQRWWLIFHPQPATVAVAAGKAAAVAAVVVAVVGVSGVGWWQWGSGDEVVAMAMVVQKVAGQRQSHGSDESCSTIHLSFTTSRRAEIPEADTPPRKRLLLTAPRPRCEVGESSAAAARQPGPTVARSVDCSFVDTMETRFRDTKRRMMTALEMVNMSVSYQADVRSRESLEFYSRHHEAQKDREAVRVKIEARVAVLETQARRHEWQRQTADDFAVQHIMRTQALEAGARIDTLEDTDGMDLLFWLAILYSLISITGNSRLVGLYKKMAPKRTTRSTTDHETTNTTSIINAQLQAMIDQGVTAALAARDALRSTNIDDSHNSGTGWNTHVKKVGHDAAYGMPWKTLMKMMTDNYCPRNENKKLEMEIWELKVKGTDLTSYTQRFQELALLCGRMFLKESDKIEKYIGANKRKFESTSRSTQNQQQQPKKRQNTGRVCTAASGEKKQYGGSKPLCTKCNYHHDGPCAPKCHKCNKVGHFARDCRSTTNTNNANNHRNPTCYECGNQGHYKSDCLELKNQDHGNQAGGTGAHGMVHALGGEETNQDIKDMENDINA